MLTEKELALGGSLYLHQCGEEPCESGHSFGPAVRDHFLIHVVFRGKGTFFSETGTYSVKAGECFLIRPGERTLYQADLSDPWHYGWVGFHGHDAGAVLSSCGFKKGVSVMSVGDIGKAEASLHRLIECHRQQGSELAQIAGIYLFLDGLCGGKTVPIKAGHAFHRVEEYMRRNFSYPVTVELLARQVNLDRSQLFRVIKKETGLSPSRYITAFRLRESQQLLLKTDLSITEVMLSVGFDDLSRFSRCFKESFGISPREYRASLVKAGGEENETR